MVIGIGMPRALPPRGEAARGGNSESLRTQREKEEGAAASPMPGARVEVEKGI